MLLQLRLKQFIRVTLPLACVRPMGELGALLEGAEAVSRQTQTFSSGIAKHPQVNSGSMSTELLFLLVAGVFVVAALYSSVGHAGASGYIAVMSLLSLAPASIKPTALALNILVASIATWQFARSGHFSWRLFWPFAAPAIPAAFMGGYMTLDTQSFKVLLGAVLLFSAARFVFESTATREPQPPSIAISLIAGAAIGFLSGLTGTGGGIFLTPLILIMGWANPKPAAAVSALFILFNSTAGLLGNFSSTQQLPSYLWMLLAAAAAGGLMGSHLGAGRVPSAMIKKLLAAVLLIAGSKLLFT